MGMMGSDRQQVERVHSPARAVVLAGEGPYWTGICCVTFYPIHGGGGEGSRKEYIVKCTRAGRPLHAQ